EELAPDPRNRLHNQHPPTTRPGIQSRQHRKASSWGAHCLIENVNEERAPLTGGASPNRAGGADGETYQHGCAARGGVGGGGALRIRATARERAHSGRTNGDDGLASQARGTGVIGRRGELEVPTAFL